MTAKRFTETWSTGIVTDHETGKQYKCEMRIDEDFLDLVNEIAEDNVQYKLLVNDLKRQVQKLKNRLKDLGVEYYD